MTQTTRTHTAWVKQFRPFVALRQTVFRTGFLYQTLFFPFPFYYFLFRKDYNYCPSSFGPRNLTKGSTTKELRACLERRGKEGPRTKAKGAHKSHAHQYMRKWERETRTSSIKATRAAPKPFTVQRAVEEWRRLRSKLALSALPRGGSTAAESSREAEKVLSLKKVGKIEFSSVVVKDE